MTSPLSPPPIDHERRYSEEEFLALEEQIDYRIEWFDGRIVPKYGYETDAQGRIPGMAGASQQHNRITRNALVSLHSRLDGNH